MVVEHSDRTDFTLPVDEPNRVGMIVSHFLGYVRDNSLWTAAGPIDGTRMALTAGIGNDFTNARFDNWLLRADLRQYFRLGLRSSNARTALSTGAAAISISEQKPFLRVNSASLTSLSS